MNENERNVDALNKLLQGEYMAIDAFNVFITKLDDDHSKDIFKEVQNRHRKNIKELAGYIQSIEGKPDENLGMKGFMADLKLSFELKSEDDSKIINKAIEGETTGLNMAEKVLRGNLSDDSRKIAGEILEKDRKSLDKLNKLV